MGLTSAAEFILRAKLDEKTLADVGKKFNKTAVEISAEFDKQISKINIDDDLKKSLDAALDSVHGMFRKLDLSSIEGNFAEQIINTDDVEKQKQIIQDFIHSIDLLKSATSGYSLNIFEKLDSSGVEKIIDLQDKVSRGFSGASNNLYNFIKPLLSQLKTAQQMYDKIKAMGTDDVFNRLEKLSGEAWYVPEQGITDELQFDNKQLREFIVLYEHAQEMLSKGLDLGIDSNFADELNKTYTAAIEKYKKNGSTWIEGYNSIEFADKIQAEAPVTTVPVKVVPDVSSFEQETKQAIEGLGITSSVPLTPVADENFEKTARSLTKDDSNHGKLYLDPALAKNFKSTAKTLIDNTNLTGKVTLNPALSTTFVSDTKKKIEKKEIKADIKISPKVTSDAQKSVSTSIDNSLKNTNSISSKLDNASKNANSINQFIKEAKESTEQTINAVKEAFRQVNKLKNSLKGISDFEHLSSLTEFFKSIQIKEGLGEQLSKLADDLNKFAGSLNIINQDSATTFAVILETIKNSGLTEKQIENFKEVPNVIQGVYDAINSSSVSISDKNVKSFLDYLSEILQKSKELQNLVTILNKTKTEDLKNSGFASGTEDAEALKRVLNLYKDLTQLEKERSSASGEQLNLINAAIEGNRETAEELNKQVQASQLLTEEEKERARIAQENYDIQRAASDIKIQDTADKSEIKDKRSEEIKNRANQINEILSNASAEWQRVIDVASGDTDWFGNAIEDGKTLLDTLGRVVKIVKTISTDAEGNIRSLKYTLTDETGNTQTIDATKNVQSYKEAITDVTAALNLLKQTQGTVKYADANKNDYSKSYNNLVDKLREANNQLDIFITNHTEEGSNIIRIVGDEVKEYTKLVDEVKDANAALSEAWKGSSQKERDNFLTSINNWEKNNSRGAGLYSKEIEAIKTALSSLGKNANVDELNNVFTKITNSIHEAGLEGQSFGNILSGQLTSKVASFVATFLSIQDIIRYVQEAVSTIEDLDYALLDLSKTAAMTESQLNDFYYSANDSAQALGVTTEEIIDLASGWSRLGYNTNETATELAELTAKFAAISPGMTTSEAQSGMTSIMKAWSDRINAENMEAEVLDKINVLGNNFALENDDVISGMQQCSAALAVMGTSYEDAFALFTGAQEIMQDADKVGNGLKSVAMRIRGYSEDVESGEYVVDDSLKNISGDLIELTKVAGDPILQNGISIYTDDTKYLDDAEKKYKSLVQYLGELADNWDKFSETTQTQLLQKLFAKTQATTGGAIISNFDQVRAALEAMEHSAGSAEAEMEKVEETITFKLNKLKEVWVGFLQDAASKELIKDIIDGLTKISEVIIKILETPGLNVAAIGGLLTLIVTKFKDASNSVTLFFNTIKSLSGNGNKIDRTGISSSVFDIIAEMMNGSSDFSNIEDGVELLGKLQSEAENTSQTVLETGAAIANTSSTANNGVSIINSLSKAFSALAEKLNISKVALGGVMALAATAATVIGVKLYKTYKKESEYVDTLNSNVKGLTNTFNSNNSEIKSTVSSIDSVSEKYQKLAAGVDKYGNNVSLSNDDFEEYNKISNQIAEAFPKLITGYSDTGTAILDCKDNIELLNEACKDKSFESYVELLSGDNMSNLGKAIGVIYNGYESDIFKIKTAGTDQQKEDLKSFEQELVNFQSIIKQAKSKGYTISSLLAANEAVTYGGVADQDAYQYYLSLSNILKQIATYGKEFNIDTSGIQLDYNVSADALDSVIDGIIARFDLAESDIKSKEDEAQSNFDTMVNGILHSSEKFKSLDDTTIENLRKFLTSTADIKGMVNPFTNELEESTLRDWIDGLVEDNDWNKVENKLNQLFSFDSSSYPTLGEAQEALDEILNALANYLDEDANELKIKLGFDTVDNNIDKMVAAALYGTDVEKAIDKNADRAVESYEQQIATAERKYEKAVSKRKSQHSTSNVVGNVDLNNRNVVAGVTMASAGWEGDQSTYSTIDTVTETLNNLSDTTGETAFVVNITPILPTGEVLTQESYANYLNYLIKNASSGEDILNADKPENGGYGLVLDAFDTITDGDGKQQAITWDNVGTAIDVAEKSAENYHNEQASIYDEEGEALLNMMELIQKKNEKIQESTDVSNAEADAELQATQELSNKRWSTDQQQAFLEFCTEAGDKYASYTEKIKAFEQQFNESTSGFDMTTFSSNIEEFQKINEAYQKVAENISKGKIGKEIASDITAVEELRATFENIDISEFTDFESFDQIEQVLTSGTATAQEAQDGWDALATSYWGAKLAAGNYSEEVQALVSTQLQANGVTKESADTFVQALTAEANAKQMVADSGKELTEMSAQEISAMLAEANGSQLDAAALLKLYLAKLQVNGATVFTADDIANIEALGKAADINTAKLLAFQKAKANNTALESAYNDPNVTDKQIARLQKNAKTLYSEAMAEVQAAASAATGSYSGLNLGYQPTSSGSSGGGGGSSDSDESTDEWLETYEEAYDRLGELRDRDKIDEYEYLQYLRALYEKFFKNKEKYAEEYEKYESEYLEGMKSLYESVFSYLSNKINKQISKLNDQKSAATESLNSQKSAAVAALNAEKRAAVAAIEDQINAIKKQQDAIQDQIDAYQDEIDAINDANDAREREITLQKALYDLDKLNSQRTNLVYSESKGMHYESDLSGIRDARESVQDAKDDIAIANLEKKIELLEKEKDALDDLIDELEEQKDAIEDYYDNLIEETEAYWDNLIEESEAYYDSLIDKFQEQADRIDDIQDKLELAEMLAAIQDLTGQDLSGMWDGLFDGSEEAWAQLESVIGTLEDGYMSIVATMNNDNDHVMEMFNKIADVDLSQTKNYLEETATAFDKLSACDFDVVANGVEGLRNAFSSLSEDSDVLSVLGQHIGEGVAQALEEAKTSAEEGSKAITESVGEGMTSPDAITSVEEGGKKVAESAVDSVGKAVESGELKASTDVSGLKVSTAVGEGMTAEPAVAVLDEAGVKVVQTAATGVSTAAESSEETVVAGDAIVTSIINSMIDSLNGGAGIIGLQMFVDSFAAALQTAFSSLDTSNLLDLGQLLGITSAEDVEGVGTGSLSSIFQQLLDDITELNNQFQTIDISNVISQFTLLKQAITDASAALGGEGGAMMSESGESGSTGTGANGTSGTSGSKKTSNTGGSLTEAMQTFGDTANEVLGGGDEGGEGNGDSEEGGSGVIGKFATLRTKVEDVTAAIGLGDDEGGGGSAGKSSGTSSDEGGTLIEALQAEEEVAMDEEMGLPKQVSMWQELYDNINKCIEAVHRLIEALSELEEFSLTVVFKGHSKAGGTAGSHAKGTVTFANGTFNVSTHGYANGKIGLEKDQRALVSEQGVEGLVRDGQFQLIGQRGAEMMDLKKGDIIFSHSQTMALLKHGRINSRGKTIGNHAYADGTPINGMFNFAGKDISSSVLNAISAQLTGVLTPMSSNIDTINRNVADLAASVSNVSSVNQTSNITIGDIHVSGVQDTDSFAKAIKSYLPSKMMQELHK